MPKMAGESGHDNQNDELAPSAAESARLQACAPEERLEEEAWASIWRENRRILLLALALAGVVALVHFTPLSGLLENAQQWKRWIREFGWMAILGYGGLAAIAVMLGVPRSVTCLAAGGLFGSLLGIAVS